MTRSTQQYWYIKTRSQVNIDIYTVTIHCKDVYHGNFENSKRLNRKFADWYNRNYELHKLKIISVFGISIICSLTYFR